MLRELSLMVASMSAVALTSAADPPTEWALGNPKEYSVATDESVPHGQKPTTRLAAKTKTPNRFGSLGRSLKGKALQSVKGKRVKFTAHVRSKDMRRDDQMARNLVWLSRHLYPRRKIIVWAASFHIMRNPAEIEVLDKSLNYQDLNSMGHLVHGQLGNQLYTIGFTAYDGAAGSWMAPRPFEISVPPAGTLEDICHKAGLENGMIALDPADEQGKWLTKKLYARPLGYSWMRANWHRHFDAMIFNHSMSPSTGR